MTIKKKATKAPVAVQDNFEELITQAINRGGKTANDDVSEAVPLQRQQKEKMVRLTLRIPESLITKIRDARKNRVGSVSLNQLILEAISSSVK